MRRRPKFTFLILQVFFLATSLSARAEELDLKPDKPVDAEVENLYDRLDQQSEDQYQQTTQEVKQSAAPAETAPKKDDVEVDKLSDLARLQAFEDIAVIQKRYLPKTQRFQISALGFTNINNPFFNNLGAGLQVAYHFNENWGIEGLGDWFGVAARDVTKDLENKAEVKASNTVTARSFLGAAIKWSPIYGKISLLNKSIVPFDLSFSVGGGLTKTDVSGGEPTVHLGTSQDFAVSKSWSVRWDIMWNLYSATAIDENGNKGKLAQNDLFIGLGLSLYIPEATYR